MKNILKYTAVLMTSLHEARDNEFYVEYLEFTRLSIMRFNRLIIRTPGIIRYKITININMYYKLSAMFHCYSGNSIYTVVCTHV